MGTQPSNYNCITGYCVTDPDGPFSTLASCLEVCAISNKYYCVYHAFTTGDNCSGTQFMKSWTCTVGSEIGVRCYTGGSPNQINLIRSGPYDTQAICNSSSCWDS